MASGIIPLIKQAAMDVIENSQMTDLRFGTVVSTDPLKVRITNQFTIPEELLIVPMHLTDYTIRVNFDWNTETDGEHSHMHTDAPSPTPVATLEEEGFNAVPRHHHQILSENDDNKTKEITILSHLHVGEKVALLRKQGGQHYYILDRVDTEKEIEEIK